MNNLQVGNGYIIFEGLAPDLAQGFGAAGGVGGAGAGQLDRRDAGDRQQIFGIDAVGRGPVAEHCLNGRFCQKRCNVVRHHVPDRGVRRAGAGAAFQRVPQGEAVAEDDALFGLDVLPGGDRLACLLYKSTSPPDSH